MIRGALHSNGIGHRRHELSVASSENIFCEQSSWPPDNTVYTTEGHTTGAQLPPSERWSIDHGS